MLHRFLQDVCFFSEEAASPEDIWPLFICQYLSPTPCLSWPYEPAFRLLLTSHFSCTASGRKRAVAECWHYLWCAVKKKTSSELVSNCLSSGLPFFCLLSWKGIIGADLLGFMFLLFCSCLSQFREAMCWGQFDVVCKCSDESALHQRCLILFVACNLPITVSVLWFSSLLVVPFLEFAVAFYTARVHQRVLNTPNSHQFIMVATKKKRKERCNS